MALRGFGARLSSHTTPAGEGQEKGSRVVVASFGLDGERDIGRGAT
jgi:hypothetical protein